MSGARCADGEEELRVGLPVGGVDGVVGGRGEGMKGDSSIVANSRLNVSF